MIESSGLRHFEAKELLIQNMEVLFYVTVAVYIYIYLYAWSMIEQDTQNKWPKRLA